MIQTFEETRIFINLNSSNNGKFQIIKIAEILMCLMRLKLVMAEKTLFIIKNHEKAECFAENIKTKNKTKHDWRLWFMILIFVFSCVGGIFGIFFLKSNCNNNLDESYIDISVLNENTSLSRNHVRDSQKNFTCKDLVFNKKSYKRNNFLTNEGCTLNYVPNFLINRYALENPHYYECYKILKSLYEEGPEFSETLGFNYKNCISIFNIKDYESFFHASTEPLISVTTEYDRFLSEEGFSRIGGNRIIYKSLTYDEREDIFQSVGIKCVGETLLYFGTPINNKTIKQNLIFNEVFYFNNIILSSDINSLIKSWVDLRKGNNAEDYKKYIQPSFNQRKLILIKLIQILKNKKGYSNTKYLKYHDEFISKATDLATQLDIFIEKLENLIIAIYEIDSDKLHNLKPHKHYLDILMDIIFYGFYHDLKH